MADKKTPNQRLNELRQAAAEKRDMLRQNQAVSPEEMERSVTVLLSLRALETGALNENSTVAAIDRTWQKTRNSSIGRRRASWKGPARRSSVNWCFRRMAARN